MRDWTTLLLIALALGVDAFSLALGLGITRPGRRYVWRTSLMVGLFHIIMPLAGILVGTLLGGMIGRVALWLGGGLLVFLGVKMAWNGVPQHWRHFGYPQPQAKPLNLVAPVRTKSDIRWRRLLALSWGVSMDAFGVGVGLGTTMRSLTLFIIILGITAALMTAAGLYLGRWISYGIGGWAEFAGGLILAVMGVKLLW